MPSSSKSKTLGNRSCSLATPVEWNNLPAYIRNAQSLIIFKNLLKTHLFRLAHETALITPHEFIHTYACTKLLTLHKHTYISKHIYIFIAHRNSLTYCKAHLNISAWKVRLINELLVLLFLLRN